jgi:hypothetical protein
MKQILTIALVLSLIGLFIQVHSTFKAQSELTDAKLKYQALHEYSDSLYTELYPAQNELNRYIEALHIFMKRNPKAADQYATIISDETE